MVRRAYLQPWVDSGNGQRRLVSAATVLRFALNHPDVLPEQRNRLITESLWFVTETEGKYGARYKTRGVLDLEAEAPIANWQSRLRHEHVVTRKQLADRLRAGEDPERVVADAVACIVTKEEHDKLTPFDRTHKGWDRYRAAGIEVIDTSTGDRFV